MHIAVFISDFRNTHTHTHCKRQKLLNLSETSKETNVRVCVCVSRVIEMLKAWERGAQKSEIKYVDDKRCLFGYWGWCTWHYKRHTLTCVYPPLANISTYSIGNGVNIQNNKHKIIFSLMTFTALEWRKLCYTGI